MFLYPSSPSSPRSGWGPSRRPTAPKGHLCHNPCPPVHDLARPFPSPTGLEVPYGRGTWGGGAAPVPSCRPRAQARPSDATHGDNLTDPRSPQTVAEEQAPSWAAGSGALGHRSHKPRGPSRSRPIPLQEARGGRAGDSRDVLTGFGLGPSSPPPWSKQRIQQAGRSLRGKIINVPVRPPPPPPPLPLGLRTIGGFRGGYQGPSPWGFSGHTPPCHRLPGTVSQPPVGLGQQFTQQERGVPEK